MKVDRIEATYSHGTVKFWVYVHESDLGIFKFWIPHTKKTDAGYRPLPPPKTRGFLVNFRREGENDEVKR